MFVTSCFMFYVERLGSVYAWGYGAEGQAGQGNVLHQRTPRRIENLEPISQVSIRLLVRNVHTAHCACTRMHYHTC